MIVVATRMSLVPHESEHDALQFGLPHLPVANQDAGCGAISRSLPAMS
jgi:hypothetical protein